jgi:hypothetical protein
MRTLAIASVLTISLSVGLTGCSEPISAPSAFSEERYLCDAEHLAELDAIVGECRGAHLRDGSCSGFVSFRGMIDSQAVVVDAPTSRVAFNSPVPGEAPVNGFSLWARAPYFELRVSIVDASTAAVGTSEGSVSLFDFINLEARGGNYLSAWVNETRDVQVLTPDEVRFTFSTDLKRGGHLEGCLDVFVGTQP